MADRTGDRFDEIRERIGQEPRPDMGNDVNYLLGLIAEALEDGSAFDTDFERAAWAVSQWCQELQYQPDLRDYTTGLCVPFGKVPGDLERAKLREHREGEAELEGSA